MLLEKKVTVIELAYGYLVDPSDAIEPVPAGDQILAKFEFDIAAHAVRGKSFSNEITLYDRNCLPFPNIELKASAEVEFEVPLTQE